MRMDCISQMLEHTNIEFSPCQNDVKKTPKNAPQSK